MLGEGALKVVTKSGVDGSVGVKARQAEMLSSIDLSKATPHDDFVVRLHRQTARNISLQDRRLERGVDVTRRMEPADVNDGSVRLIPAVAEHDPTVELQGQRDHGKISRRIWSKSS